MPDEKGDEDEWDEYPISKDAIALVNNLLKQKDLVTAQMAVIENQIRNMVGVIAQSIVGEPIADGTPLEANWNKGIIRIGKNRRIPIGGPVPIQKD